MYIHALDTHTHTPHTHTHTHTRTKRLGGGGGGGGADLCTMGKKHIKFWTLRPTLSAFGSSVENEFPYTLKARNGSFGVFNVLLMCC